jgi:hypothetical protein
MGDSPAAVHDDLISKYGKQMEREKMELLFSLHNEKLKRLNSLSEKKLKNVANKDTLRLKKATDQDTLLLEKISQSNSPIEKETIHKIKKSNKELKKNQFKNNWNEVGGSDFCLFLWILIFVYYTVPQLIPLAIGLCCLLNRCFDIEKIFEDTCNYVNQKIEWGMRRYLNLNESPAVQVVFTNNMLKKVEKRDQPGSPVIHYEPKDGLADLSTNKLSLELIEDLTLAPCDVRSMALAEGTSGKADTVLSVSPIYQENPSLKTSIKNSRLVMENHFFQPSALFNGIPLIEWPATGIG